MSRDATRVDNICAEFEIYATNRLRVMTITIISVDRQLKVTFCFLFIFWGEMGSNFKFHLHLYNPKTARTTHVDLAP